MSRPQSSVDAFNRALSSGNHAGCLLEIATNEPQTPSAEDRKNVLFALAQFKKEEDMNKALNELPTDHVDSIMRYIYAGLASGDEKNADVFLRFHAAATTRGGTGSICRVLSDKSRPVLL